MEREKEGEIEKKVSGLNIRKILGARAIALGASPTPEHLDLMLENYYAHTNGANVLNEAAINSSIHLYLTVPVMKDYSD